MRANATERPTVKDIVSHPILHRARIAGQAALTPEPDGWLAQLLADFPPSANADAVDVEMA
jgi:hypothetical protein